MNLNASTGLKKEVLEINIPPNFNIYANEEENDQNDKIFDDIPRIAETNPMTCPLEK